MADKLKKNKKQIIVKEEDYDSKTYLEWYKTITILKWEHDFEKKLYVIDYEEQEIKEN